MEEESAEKFVREIERLELSQYLASIELGMSLENLMKNSPPKVWIPQVQPALEKALDAAYTDKDGKNMRSYISVVAGGPHEACPHAAYNFFGAAYPYLNREEKDMVLQEVFKCLRGNYLIIQLVHTPGIREPLLLSDVCIIAHLYWPGLDKYKQLICGFSSFEQFQHELMDKEGFFKKEKVESDFLLATAVLRSDFCDFGEQYARSANPFFFERVMKSIVALRFAWIEQGCLIDNLSAADSEIKEVAGKERLKQLLPANVHPQIEYFKAQHDWVDYRKVDPDCVWARVLS